MEIKYTQVGGLFFVSLVGYNQQIVCFPKPFGRITGADERALIGVRDVTSAQATELGFIVPAEAALAV